MRLGIRTYKCLAMLASILPHVYVDKDWVAEAIKDIDPDKIVDTEPYA
jgi:hypothetical protein